MDWSGSHAARRLAALAVALGCGALVACLLELPAVCGDGHVDPGEECDPAAAGADLSRCDPVDCTQ